MLETGDLSWKVFVQIVSASFFRKKDCGVVSVNNYNIYVMNYGFFD